MAGKKGMIRGQKANWYQFVTECGRGKTKKKVACGMVGKKKAPDSSLLFDKWPKWHGSIGILTVKWLDCDCKE